MTGLFIGVGALVLLGAVLLAVAVMRSGEQRRQRRAIPVYQSRNGILSDNEKAYYKILLQVVGSHSQVFPKIRLADIVNPPPASNHHYKVHWQRVQRRYVDFLLCTPANLAPVLVIRLESRADKRRRQQEGMDIVDDVLDMAGIPILRADIAPQYDPVAVAREVRAALTRKPGGGLDAPVSRSAQGSGSTLSEFARTKLPTFHKWTSVLWGLVAGQQSRSRTAGA